MGKAVFWSGLQQGAARWGSSWTLFAGAGSCTLLQEGTLLSCTSGGVHVGSGVKVH